ncbi:uncharacterized protein BJ171DRAFT_641908 [Polychytrium aggregatum]|uniref:uncharacterized protein n=1 Tax=Polychytrium aggregatum TaxID=110093 RepID=UPI0022FF1548|nr:uncharacterized protein BJ171DRAFT_641908 [Polychytrium aggregatum]KAI9207051.1 hypothetical protein BJ171DRAFT_641908 [Polychytrium aggregatum]
MSDFDAILNSSESDLLSLSYIYGSVSLAYGLLSAWYLSNAYRFSYVHIHIHSLVGYLIMGKTLLMVVYFGAAVGKLNNGYTMLICSAGDYAHQAFMIVIEILLSKGYGITRARLTSAEKKMAIFIGIGLTTIGVATISYGRFYSATLIFLYCVMARLLFNTIEANLSKAASYALLLDTGGYPSRTQPNPYHFKFQLLMHTRTLIFLHIILAITDQIMDVITSFSTVIRESIIQGLFLVYFSYFIYRFRLGDWPPLDLSLMLPGSGRLLTAVEDGSIGISTAMVMMRIAAMRARELRNRTNVEAAADTEPGAGDLSPSALIKERERAAKALVLISPFEVQKPNFSVSIYKTLSAMSLNNGAGLQRSLSMSTSRVNAIAPGPLGSTSRATLNRPLRAVPEFSNALRQAESVSSNIHSVPPVLPSLYVALPDEEEKTEPANPVLLKSGYL